MLSATASLGLILLWDVDGGLTQIDKYLYSSEDFIKSGALLACGIVNSGVRNECDPALALLSDYIGHKVMVSHSVLKYTDTRHSILCTSLFSSSALSPVF